MSTAPQAGDGSDLTGSTLAGRYRILRKLGEGAMGDVYLGEHLRIGRRDAIKVLRDALSSDAEAIARFTRGARNVSAIRHPNVCTIYDFSDTDDGVQFLAMEYVEGETLKELLDREGHLPLAHAAAIAVQAAEALQAAHEEGIVHRDLKPANIMVAQRRGAYAVKVVDFDIAKGTDEREGAELTRVGFVVGTPEYMSPEQLIGEPLDGRSDVYSLALVLFRMLTGTLPFRAESAQEVIIQRLTHSPLPLARARPELAFPPGLQEVLDHALAREPERRTASAAEFGRMLAGVAVPSTAGSAPPPRPALSATGVGAALPGPGRAEEGLPATRLSGPPPAPQSEPPPAAPTAPLPRSRSRALAVAGGAAAVLLMGAGAWYALAGDGGAAEEALLAGTVAATPAAAVDGYRPPASATAAEEPGAEPASAAPLPEPPRQSGGRGDSDPPAVGSPPARGSAPEPAAGAPPPPAPAASAAETEDGLWRLFERLGAAYPSRSSLRAVHDSARAVWAHDASGRENRAFAAYIAASSLAELGDTAQAVSWVQRALELRPDGPGYRTLLNALRAPAP